MYMGLIWLLLLLIMAKARFFLFPETLPIRLVGTEEDPLDRELQSRELARIMAKSYPQPVVFLGYVVTRPLAPQRKDLTQRHCQVLILSSCSL